MIKIIVLSMESEPIYELLEPGDVLILYREKNSYVYAVNKDGGLTVERALVLPQYSKPVEEVRIIGIAAEDMKPGVPVRIDLSTGLIYPISATSKPDQKVEESDNNPHDFSGYSDHLQRKKEKDVQEKSNAEKSRAQKIINEWHKKCDDCKKESDSWPGYLAVGNFKNCTP